MKYTTPLFTLLTLPILPVFASNITIVNSTPATVHLDYTSCTLYHPAAGEPANPGPDGDGNLAEHTSAIYTCANGQTMQWVQYSSSLGGKTACYIDINNDTAQLNTQQSANCSVQNNTATLAWPTPSFNYTQVAKDVMSVAKAFVAYKTADGSGSTTSLLPNVIPMSKAQLTTALSSTDNGWSLQFAYDAIRFPLWNGAYCLQNPSNDFCTQTTKPFLTDLMNFFSQHVPNANINSAGYWAYNAYGNPDGSTVSGGSSDAVIPALIGPLAIGEAAVHGKSAYYTTLKNQLDSYKLSENTPKMASGLADYGTTSGPYFSGTLDLLSEALLAGNGSFSLSATDPNYQSFLSDGFLASLSVTSSSNAPYDALRVIFSVDNAPHTTADSWAHAGDEPTVSEGMAYGLLIAYAAKDQATFDKMLNYILYEARTVGCAGMDSTQTNCSTKTTYLMPWMIDATGQAFHYTNAGGWLTNGSATDADINIVWALNLAANLWHDTPSAAFMEKMSYTTVAKNMINEIANFDFNQNVSDIQGTTYPVLFGPGSQWGTGGRDVLYPGYDAPQALMAMDALTATK